MELRHARYFEAVARHGGFSAAARALRVAQPALSQAVKDLEAEIGARLLERDTRSVRTTAAGEIFAGHARALLERAEEAVEETRRAARGEVGTLRVGFLGSATSPFLSALVKTYRRRFPLVALHLHEMTPVQQITAFAERRIDIGFTRPAGAAGRELGLVETRLYEDRLFAVLPTAHPRAGGGALAMKTLAAEPFVLFHRAGAPGLHDAALALCQRAGFSPRVVAEPDLMATVLTLVEAELGVALVPGCVRNLRPAGVVFREVKPSGVSIPLVMARRRVEETPTCAAFAALVNESRAEIVGAMGEAVDAGDPR